MDAWLGVFFSYHLKILKTRSCVPCFKPGQSWEFQHFPEFNCSNRSTTRGLTFILNFKQTPNEAPVKQQSYSCSWVVLYAHIRQKSQDMMLHIRLFPFFFGLLNSVSLHVNIYSSGSYILIIWAKFGFWVWYAYPQNPIYDFLDGSLNLSISRSKFKQMVQCLRSQAYLELTLLLLSLLEVSCR